MNYYKITTSVLSTVSGHTPPTTGLGIYAHRTSSASSYKLKVNGTETLSTSNDDFPLRATGIPTGWTFARWECDSDRDATLTTNPSSDWKPSNNPGHSTSRATECTVKLYLTPTVYTVAFNADGGSPTPSSLTGLYGDTITLPDGPTKSGYSFTGWLIGSTVYAAQSQYTISADVTAVAQWTQTVLYTVAFDKNALDVTGPAIPNVTVEPGGSVTMPSPSGWSRANHSFTWWNTAADGSGLSIPAGTAFVPSGNTTMYAQWSESVSTGALYNTINEETYGQIHTIRRATTHCVVNVTTNLATDIEITYQTRSQGSGTETRQLVDGNNRPTGNPTTTTWSNSADYTETLSIAAGTSSFAYVCSAGSSDRGAVSMYRWSRPNSTYATITTVNATNFPASSWQWVAPTLPNFDFDGWYTPTQTAMERVEQGGTLLASDYTVLVDANRITTWGVIEGGISGCLSSSTSTTANYTNFLRLIYRGVKVLVLLAANGGELLGDFWVYVRYFEPYGALPTPTRAGYTFAGWYTAATGGTLVTSLTTVTARTNHTLYAHWSPSVTPTHTVYFNATGGTVSTASIAVAEGSTLGTLPTPTRTGYTFAGWYTSQAGGTQITAATVMGDDDIWAYALWTANTITVTFNANGGTVTETTRTVAVGSQYQRLPVPTWAGHNFDGWFTAATGGTEVTAADYPTASQPLYAHWSNGQVDWWGVTFG